MRIDYNKLVRDKIPEAIEADGHSCFITSLDPNEYVLALRRKLIEEAHEALEAATADDLLLELADLLEVIISLSETTGVSFEVLDSVRQQRKSEKGGFDRRLMLCYVDRVG